MDPISRIDLVGTYLALERLIATYFNYEIFAVATCQWEHQLDSQWVMATSAPDNFLFPRIYGETLDNDLDRLDPSIFSGARDPNDVVTLIKL